MFIIIDRDNDEVRFGNDERKLTSYPLKGRINLTNIEILIRDIVNNICDGNDHPFITIQRQNEGVISTIEEY